jgi:uncharacterized protein (DUF3084 family)
MKLRERREVQAKLDEQMKRLRARLEELAHKREDTNRADWQFVNAQYNQVLQKIDKLKTDMRIMFGNKKAPKVVNFHRLAQPFGQMKFN